MSVRHSGIVHVEPRLCWIIAKRKLRLDDVVVQLRMSAKLKWEIAVDGNLQVQSLEVFRCVELLEILDSPLHDLLRKRELLRVTKI